MASGQNVAKPSVRPMSVQNGSVAPYGSITVTFRFGT